MSFSNPTINNINPAKKFFQWSGSEGKIKYYDGATKETIHLDLPFKFIQLDRLSTITGWSDTDESRYFSNEVRSLKVEPFLVKTKNGVKKEGLWADISESIKAQGAKFATSVYITYLNEDKKLELANFKFFGSSITEWINFGKENKIKDGDTIVIDGAVEAKKGKTVYYTPTFSIGKSTEKELEEAKELDRELQKYLNIYFSYSKDKTDSTEKTDEDYADSKIEVEDQDIPF